ncbi:hypothetical protein B0919_23305 [Hymenobacter sp. CRA2]|nr:hypothetical protein B0919_23305 [Hymenobacter sp. CRA2]
MRPTPAPDAAANANKTNIVPGEFQAYNSFDHRYEGIVGTPYLIKGWTPTTLQLVDKRQVDNVPARYDVYRQVLVIRPDNKSDSVWLDATRLTGFVLPPLLSGQPARVFQPFADAPQPDQRRAFAEVLYQGAAGYTLLKLPRKILVKANYQGGYAADRRYDELVDRNTYFLRRPDGTVAEVKLNRKSLAAAAGSLQPGLSSSKADIKTEQDAVQALQAAEVTR